jgi:hypothetical protein
MSSIKRIPQELAHTYIPVSEDFTGSEPTFYTLTINSDDPEWDDVTYYTSRRINLYENREGDGDSWIYVLSNKNMPNLFKIGFTTKTPDKRAQQISRGTGVPTNFTVEYALKCFNGQALEAEIHKYLHSYRVNNDREFFQVPLDEAKRVVDLLGVRYTNNIY